jgi:hypothetical protein
MRARECHYDDILHNDEGGGVVGHEYINGDEEGQTEAGFPTSSHPWRWPRHQTLPPTLKARTIDPVGPSSTNGSQARGATHGFRGNILAHWYGRSSASWWWYHLAWVNSTLTNFSSSKLKMEVVDMYAAGLYTCSIFARLIWETRPPDFVVSMMSHHILIVVILLALSYTFRHVLNNFLSDGTIPSIIYYTSSVTWYVLANIFAHVGSVVLPLHDARDIFLEIGKMSKNRVREHVKRKTWWVIFLLAMQLQHFILIYIRSYQVFLLE